MRSQSQEKAFSRPIHDQFDFNRLRVSLNWQRQEDIEAVMNTLISRGLMTSDGARLGKVIDVLISDWDHRPKYLKCQVDHAANGQGGPRLVYYPIKYLFDLSPDGVVATHTLSELLQDGRFHPAAVRRDELFPLVSLLAFVRHSDRFAANLVDLH